jgi:TorA maturation chaperone TorD
MRDSGLDEAIRAVGGVSELARRLGISQPSVSNWDRVPAERVPAVEAVTGIERAVLRPDLYDATTVPIDAADTARAAEYALLAKLLAQAPDTDFLRRLARLSGDATPLGIAHAELGAAAARTNREEVEREFFHLFIGVGRSELLPYGSYYLTGFLHERPLARLRADLLRIGIERVEPQPEPEDHAAILCEIMSGLAAGTLGAPGMDRHVFEKHVAAWMPRFFAELEEKKSAGFYARVGGLGRVFMDIEAQAFALPP